MPIQEQNIVFVESQVMDDVPEGGGAATGSVIVDGQMNNVFEDISDLDRAYGRFNLRKIFLAVRTLSTDIYGGAKTVVTALPQDDALGYTLFSTRNAFDTRLDAADRVEAYLYKGPMWAGYLYENHIAGMRAISLVMQIGSPLPTLGKTLCMVQDEGLAGEKEQYVRVTRVTTSTQQFEDSNGVFERWVVTLDLSDALRHNFTGFAVARNDTSLNFTGKTRIRNTSVADAARYYGAQPLAASAAIGDLQVRATSLFTQLVPSTQIETPLVNQPFAPELVQTFTVAGREVQYSNAAHTLSRNVTAENRRLNWIETLRPLPAPGLLTVAFRAQGDWYSLVADEAGVLAGADATNGAGTLNYTTGVLAVTLGALPDAGSQIVITWASPVHIVVRTEATLVQPVWEIIGSPAGAIQPGSVSVSWQAASVTKTITDAASDGLLTGADGEGYINYATGQGWFRPTLTPDPSSTPVMTYMAATWQLETFTPAKDGNGFVDLTVAHPIQPKTLVLEWETIREKTTTEKTNNSSSRATVRPGVVPTVLPGGSIIIPPEETDAPVRPPLLVGPCMVTPGGAPCNEPPPLGLLPPIPTPVPRWPNWKRSDV